MGLFSKSSKDSDVESNLSSKLDSTSLSHTNSTSATSIQSDLKGDATQVNARKLENHDHSKDHVDPNEGGSASRTSDHVHLTPVTKETRLHHEVEEVTRQKEIDRHLHHVQHHVQPIKDVQHAEVIHHKQEKPIQQIRESHSNTKADVAAFESFNNVKDEVIHAPVERKVIDKGVIVNENIHHHVHHVVQPVIQRESHEHHVIHTTIPVHEVTHEAPIIHQSTTHEPINMKDFVAGGGSLKSKLTHSEAGVLATNAECQSTKLAEKSTANRLSKVI